MLPTATSSAPDPTEAQTTRSPRSATIFCPDRTGSVISRVVGASAFGGSICWYWAYSLTLVAYVKAVGQFEAVIAVALSLFVWHEREALRQIPGVALILLGIALVLLG